MNAGIGLGNSAIISWNRDVESDDNCTVENCQYCNMMSSIPQLLITCVTQDVQTLQY